MDAMGYLYLGVAAAMLLVFFLLVAHTYNKRRKKSGEAPKYRMLEED